MKTCLLRILSKWLYNPHLGNWNAPINLGIFLKLPAVILESIEVKFKPFNWFSPLLVGFRDVLYGLRGQEGGQLS